jgi:hypothetical protein
MAFSKAVRAREQSPYINAFQKARLTFVNCQLVIDTDPLFSEVTNDKSTAIELTGGSMGISNLSSFLQENRQRIKKQ